MTLLTTLVPLALAAATPAAEGAEEDPCRAPLVVWCGGDEELMFRDLATSAAPILWFSPDEPLLTGRRKTSIPQAIDCRRVAADPAPESDRDEALGGGLVAGESPVVYYQVSRALLRTDPTPAIRAAFENERIPLSLTRKLTLRFFFYYEEDFGFSPHIHDLEGMELQVGIDDEPGDGRHRARLLSAKAYAHGSDWQANILQMPEDVSLPLTLMVEEGKHASCPDRNADGLYTPGWDVNVRVNDAWGVRDIFRSRVTGARFRLEEFKPRSKTTDGFKVWPPSRDASGAEVEQWSRRRGEGLELPGHEDVTYELVSAHDTPACTWEGPPEPAGTRHYLDLPKRMEEEKFGRKGADLHRHGTPYRYGSTWFLFPLRSMAPGYGNDGQSLFMLDLYFWDELPLIGGWAFLRGGRSIGDPERWLLDVGYTPSVSRVFDWYATVGAAWDRGREGGWEASFESELGLQARWNVVGFRLGVRARIDDFAISDERLVMEVGLGPFPGGSGRGRE